MLPSHRSLAVVLKPIPQAEVRPVFQDVTTSPAARGEISCRSGLMRNASDVASFRFLGPIWRVFGAKDPVTGMVVGTPLMAKIWKEAGRPPVLLSVAGALFVPLTGTLKERLAGLTPSWPTGREKSCPIVLPAVTLTASVSLP